MAPAVSTASILPLYVPGVWTRQCPWDGPGNTPASNVSRMLTRQRETVESVHSEMGLHAEVLAESQDMRWVPDRSSSVRCSPFGVETEGVPIGVPADFPSLAPQKVFCKCEGSHDVILQ